MLAPKPFTLPRARNPSEARMLYDYKLSKRFPFIMRGYDIEDMNDFRKFGTVVREDNKPIVRGLTYDTAYFFLHSQVKIGGETSFIFIHMIKDRGDISFRPLMFEGFSEAYRYAYAHGCKVNKKPNFTVDLVEFMTADTLDDIDLFVDTIDYTSGTTRPTQTVQSGMKGSRYREQ